MCLPSAQRLSCGPACLSFVSLFDLCLPAYAPCLVNTPYSTCPACERVSPHLAYLNHCSTDQLLRCFTSPGSLCPVFQRSLLREFLLTKLINAEISCYKAQQFSRLEVEEINCFYLFICCYQSLISLSHVCSPVPPLFAKLRTRSSLLESLQAELSTRSQCMMGDPSLSALPSSEGVRGASEGSGGFIENFKVNVGLPCLSYLTVLLSLYHFSSGSLSLESHKGAEPLFWNSRGTQEDWWQCITEA